VFIKKQFFKTSGGQYKKPKSVQEYQLFIYSSAIYYIRINDIEKLKSYRMKKTITLLFFFLTISAIKSNAQIGVAKLFGKNSSDYLPGLGGFLKFGFPASEAADISVEAGAIFFIDKEYPEYGILMCPFKLGYRHTFNGSGTGFYAEPQVGYNIYGIDSYYDYDTFDNVDKKFNGFIWSVGTGYLFRPSRRTQFDLGVRYESVAYNGGSKSFVSLRLSQNFSFRKRED
jgi:hypothetical protein